MEMEIEHRNPSIRWTQNDNVLYLTVEVEDLKVEKMLCKGDRFFISGTNNFGKKSYKANLELYAPIKGYRQIETARQIELVFPTESAERWPRLLKACNKAPWLRIDFNKWTDDDANDDIELDSNEPHASLDYKGNMLVLEHFYLMLKLDSSMWILSTLGGGFSSLADCGSMQFAEHALSVSRKQLTLAKHMGDDILLARCYVYIGFALAQLSHFKEAFHILIYSREVAKQLKSQLLEDLSAALYMKLKHLSIQKNNPLVTSKKFMQLSEVYEGAN
jgi:prostaglandin-E synthase